MEIKIKGGISCRAFLSDLRHADGKAADLLRIYVDEWLDSGFLKGQERPRDRSIERATRAFPALHRYLSSYGLPMILTKDGFYGHFGIGHLHPNADPNRSTEDMAAYPFAVLLASDWRFRLFKCRRCEEYGSLRRNPRRLYQRGIHCANCRNKATAISATKRARQTRHDVCLAAAVRAWRVWKPRHGDRKAFVVSAVNDELHNQLQIRTNWVTRHQSEIEAAAEVKK